MLKKILFFLGLLLVLKATCQPQGDFPISGHKPDIFGVDLTIFDIAFDHYGLMYTANSSGVMQYDGFEWDIIETPTAAFAMDVDAENRVYVGCLGSFGYLQLSTEGMKYRQLSPDSLGNDYFSSIRVVADSVIFLSQDKIWIYQTKTGNLKKYPSPDKFSLEALILEDGKLYVSTQVASYLWKDGHSTESDLWIGESYPPKKVAKAPNGDHYAVLDITGKFFQGMPGKLQQVKSIKYSVNGFEWINDSLIVVSTTDHGCSVLNARKNFSEVGIIDYKRGLPDNEVMALEVDWNMGIWIGHQFGFSRVDPLAPVHCLSNQEGLAGNLIASIFYQGELIVGTSTGLFRARQDSAFTFTREQRPARTTPSPAKNSKTKINQFLKRTFGTEEIRNSATTVKAFESAKWVFERIPEINYKVNDFQIFGDVLLVGTNDGLFEYRKGKVKRIIQQPVKEISLVPGSNEFLVRDQYGISRYLRENGEYIPMAFGQDEALVLSAYADRKGYVWMVSPGKLRNMALTYSGALPMQDLEFPNDFLEDPSIVEMKGKLYFVTSQGYYYYDYKQKSIVQDSAMLQTLGTPREHLEDDGSGFWIYDGKTWKNVDREGNQKFYAYLSLYPDIRFIHTDKISQDIYFITESNQLYRYSPAQDKNSLYSSNVFYKSLFAKAGYSPYRKQLQLDYDENYLRAEIVQPDYLGLLKVEYQHILIGMDKEWSEWSPDNTINLNFLPEGKYELQVRARDVFDRVQSIEPISLVVKPPYWQTTWFYALEVLFFASLVLISTKLNQGKAQNRFLTQALTTLTIVMIIETLQSLTVSAFAFASSPVIDFGVNLTIALVIFPLELILKNFIKSGRLSFNFKQLKQHDAD